MNIEFRHAIMVLSAEEMNLTWRHVRYTSQRFSFVGKVMIEVKPDRIEPTGLGELLLVASI